MATTETEERRDIIMDLSLKLQKYPQEEEEEKEKLVPRPYNTNTNTNTNSSSPTSDHHHHHHNPPPFDENMKIELSVLEIEMNRMKEENKVLRQAVERTMKDYSDLQMKFSVIRQNNAILHKDPKTFLSLNNTDRTASISSSSIPSQQQEEDDSGKGNHHELGLSLTLQSSSGNKRESSETRKEDTAAAVTAGEAAAGLTQLQNKLNRPSNGNGNSSSSLGPNRKARVSVRARCETATMNDGCQWRKYGQKIAKGNPCPRAYYRCTVAPGCPVRKQVQRCLEDMSILITTYEGTHNHPLPVGATAMASSTASASPPAASFMLVDSSYNNLYGTLPQPAAGNNFNQLPILPYYINSPFINPPNYLHHPNRNNYSNNYNHGGEDQHQLLVAGGGGDGGGGYKEEDVTAIASDPNFRVAVAAAISSLINNNNNNNNEENIASCSTTHHSIPTRLPSLERENGGSKKWILESLSTTSKTVQESP